jgi:hypothetical protein
MSNAAIINYENNLLIKISKIEREVEKFDDDLLIYQEVRKLHNYKKHKLQIKKVSTRNRKSYL